MWGTEPVLDPDTIADAESLDDLYERYRDAGPEPRPGITEYVSLITGRYDEKDLHRLQAYQMASADYFAQMRETVPEQDALAQDQIEYADTTIDVVGVVHGHEAIGPIELHHGMSDEVETRVHQWVDSVLEEGTVYYEEGLGTRLREDQYSDSDVRGFWDVMHTIDGDRNAEDAAQRYMIKDLAMIPVAKCVGWLPYSFSHQSLDTLQTTEHARTSITEQKDAQNAVDADLLPLHLEQEYHELIDDGTAAVTTERSIYMAERLADRADEADKDRFGAVVGLGHLSHIIDHLERI